MQRASTWRFNISSCFAGHLGGGSETHPEITLSKLSGHGDGILDGLRQGLLVQSSRLRHGTAPGIAESHIVASFRVRNHLSVEYIDHLGSEQLIGLSGDAVLLVVLPANIQAVLRELKVDIRLNQPPIVLLPARKGVFSGQAYGRARHFWAADPWLIVGEE